MEYGLISCLVKVADELGINLGANGIKVCTVDEDYLAPCGYTFTHVKQDEIAIAQKAVEMLIKRIENGENDVDPGFFASGRDQNKTYRTTSDSAYES